MKNIFITTPELPRKNTAFEEDIYMKSSIYDNSTIVMDSHLTDASTVSTLKPSQSIVSRLLRRVDFEYYKKSKNNEKAYYKDNEEDPYRWVILVSGFLAQAISMCTLSSWGVMQDYFDRKIFKGSMDATELSFVGTIGFAFCGLMGPITPFFISLLGTRWVLFFGTILISAGLILASFSTKVWHLYITQSVMHGIGAALLYIVSMSISPQWFIKRRGLAMGIMVSGSGVGGLIMPFVMTALNESLGGAWCYRVLGIISFVISMLATLLLKENPYTSTSTKTKLKEIVDLNICKDPKFIIWCLAGNLSMLSYFIPAFYLPSHATKIGLLPAQGSILVAIFSAVNVIGRIISGYLGDHIGVVNINIIFLFISGLSSLLIWTFANSFATLMIFIIIYGFMSGTVFSLLAPITAEITGMEKYPSGICLYLFFMTAARFGPTLAGAIQTATDKHSFFTYQMFTGMAFVLSAVVNMFLKYQLKPSVFAKI
ncbi:major facilitator superfamily domain-containing protein [Cokeromyces recurvatus]|uniref:major facilitator superfamily domain-containing protein n=1 Tax=Cokeromyces recurvatus TaxID=90255 RepID=UPI00221F7B0A|nr:major facilitator superfamily domain-containing protein [Cokeromyces recurvatus]KAI7902572.1 major facilitator superfamily domain-containing protein [Cokeromyces recurvatus]